MAGFASVGRFAGAEEAGRTHVCSFRKVPSQTTVAGWWCDLSMAAGNPKPNYYASSPLVAAALDGFDGLFHGSAQSPAQKYLTHLLAVSPTAGFVGQLMLLDYVLYYPFVDGDSLDEQAMDNTVTLPRYVTGDGLRVMAVNVTPTIGGGTFTFTYVDQDGNTQTSPVQSCTTTAGNIATITTSQQATAGKGPFLTLASGSRGVRSITSVTFVTGSGGLMSLVLCKPITNFAIREINTPVEVEFVSRRPGPPQIVDGAYLNFIANTPATVAAGTLTGIARFAWSE